MQLQLTRQAHGRELVAPLGLAAGAPAFPEQRLAGTLVCMQPLCSPTKDFIFASFAKLEENGIITKMPKSLEKARKKIAKKRHGAIGALHEGSRDSKRLHRAQVRDERLGGLLRRGGNKNNPWVRILLLCAASLALPSDSQWPSRPC